MSQPRQAAPAHRLDMAERLWVAFASDSMTLDYLRRRGIHPRALAEQAFESMVRQLQVDDAMTLVR